MYYKFLCSVSMNCVYNEKRENVLVLEITRELPKIYQITIFSNLYTPPYNVLNNSRGYGLTLS